jgi:alpha-tubulin suppressor-like RCC1 family protein
MKTKLSFLLLLVLLNTQIKAQCWKTMSAGTSHFIAIKTDGTLWAWGLNNYGQLGDGTYDNKSIPVQIGIETDWQKISAGNNHNLVIKNDGSLWSWGQNDEGQLGVGTFINKNTPTQIGTENNWLSISTGYAHNIAVKKDGTLWAWGLNGNGQLGLGDMSNHNVPSKVGMSIDWQNAICGGFNTIAKKSDGTLWFWGRNFEGEAGNGTNTLREVNPISIFSQKYMEYNNISVGYMHTMVVKPNGTLWTWGLNSDYQLGDGTPTDKNIPTAIGSSTNWKTVSGGTEYTVAIKTDGTLWSWGSNVSGQLGFGVSGSKKSNPTQIGTDVNWQSISARGNHTIAMKKDGTLWTWGGNYDYYVKGPLEINCPMLDTEDIILNNNIFSIYPNPAKNELNIQNLTNKVIDKIIITDLTGKKVLEQKGNNKQINVQQLQQGMYLLQAFSEEKSFQSKFIKQ